MVKNFIILFFVVLCIAPVALTTDNLMGDEIQWYVRDCQESYKSIDIYEWNPDTGEITIVHN